MGNGSAAKMGFKAGRISHLSEHGKQFPFDSGFSRWNIEEKLSVFLAGKFEKNKKTREKNVVIPGEQNERTRNGMRGIARVAS